MYFGKTFDIGYGMDFVIRAFFFLIGFIAVAQTVEPIDFLEAQIQISPNPNTESLTGTVAYTFALNAATDSLFLDAQAMQFDTVLLNSKPIDFTNTGKQIAIAAPRKIGQYELQLVYRAKPKQTVYFLGWQDQLEGNEQIWTQGQGKYTSHWLPSFDDMNEKVAFDISILFKEGYTVIANGKLTGKTKTEKGVQWHYTMERPMSSYLLAFAIGPYEQQNFTTENGTPVSLYYEPKDSLKVEPTYRYSKEIFDFLETEIGVAYPWQNYKQIPVQDFLYAGMENTGTTIFSNSFVVDSIGFNDQNYVNVNAHELAHQWFGNLVTEESGEHHWLHEGFATYYAYLAEKTIFGDDYFYWKLFGTAKTLSILTQEDSGEALTNPKAGSLTFYEKGAWALVVLRDIVGDTAFQKGIQAYLTKHAYTNVTIADFLKEMALASNEALSVFEQDWLQSTAFPEGQAMDFLKRKSNSVRNYLELKERAKADKKLLASAVESQWKDYTSSFLKEQLIAEVGSELSTELRTSIIAKEDFRSKRALANSTLSLSEEERLPFEALLQARSYSAQEATLYALWSNFPEKREAYLNTIKASSSFTHTGIHQLWLTLALVTVDYDQDLKRNYFAELVAYTKSEQHFENRLNAFRYLENLNAFSDEALVQLVDASHHYIWSFKKASRAILQRFLKGEGARERLRAIYPLLLQDYKPYIDTILSE